MMIKSFILAHPASILPRSPRSLTLITAVGIERQLTRSAKLYARTLGKSMEYERYGKR